MYKLSVLYHKLSFWSLTQPYPVQTVCHRQIPSLVRDSGYIYLGTRANKFPLWLIALNNESGNAGCVEGVYLGVHTQMCNYMLILFYFSRWTVLSFLLNLLKKQHPSVNYFSLLWLICVINNQNIFIKDINKNVKENRIKERTV